MNNQMGELSSNIFSMIEAIPGLNWLMRSNANWDRNDPHLGRYFASISTGELDAYGNDTRKIWRGYGNEPVETLQVVFQRYQAQQEPDYNGQRDPKDNEQGSQATLRSHCPHH